jgi:FkbM family methyltransferase
LDEFKKELDLLYVQSETRGAVKARNTGSYLAKGRVLAFTDDDCLPEEDWLRNAFSAFSGAEVVGVEGSIRSEKVEDPLYRSVSNAGFEGIGFMTANLFLRMDVYNKIGGFDEKFDQPHFREDTDLAWRALEQGQIPFCKDVVVFHPAHPRTVERESNQERARFFEKDALLLKKHPHKYRELFSREMHWANTEGFWENFRRGAEKYGISPDDHHDIFSLAPIASKRDAGFTDPIEAGTDEAFGNRKGLHPARSVRELEAETTKSLKPLDRDKWRSEITRWRGTRREKPWKLDFDETCSEEDVLFCFRLLLGRFPQEWEWRAHSALAGRPLKDIVSMFLDAPEFKNRKLTTSNLEEIALVKMDRYQMYVPINDPNIGSQIKQSGQYEPHITRIIISNLRPGDVACDIGANIGFFSLLCCSIVGSQGRVLSFEPYSVNVKFLHLNKHLNGFDNLTIFPFALSDKPGLLFLDHMGTNGVVSPATGDPVSVMSSEIVYANKLDNVCKDLDKLDLLKIDIEGAEYLALKGGESILRRQMPIILAEFSPPALRAVSEVSATDFLASLMMTDSYRLYAFDGCFWSDCGRDLGRVKGLYDQSGVDHIDIMAADPKVRTLQL